MTSLDLTLLPVYRLNNREFPTLPGLLAMTPPNKKARGREHDRLLIYLVLTGNATLTTAEYQQLVTQSADRFYQTGGSLTSALRTAAEEMNRTLLERNMKSTGRGQYAVGWLVLAALRGEQCTLLQSGLSHIYVLGQDGVRHIHDPALAGKGLGVGQASTSHLSQTELQPGTLLLLSGKPPAEWKQVLGKEERPGSLEATRTQLLAQAEGDLNAVLILAQAGTGKLNVINPEQAGDLPLTTDAAPISSKPLTQTEKPPVQERPETPPQQPGKIGAAIEPRPDQERNSYSPSAYGIPPQSDEEPLPEVEEVVPQFPASIPRTAPPVSAPMPSSTPEESPGSAEKASRKPTKATRLVARILARAIQSGRRMGDSFSRTISRFLPNLLPGETSSSSSSMVLFFIAIAVPVLVVTVASVVYFRFGRSYQYDDFYRQAENARAQAVSASDAARQRDGWQAVLFYLEKAEAYRETPESQALRNEALTELDNLLGIKRLNFFPAFSSGVNAQISRLAANDTDLYLLDAERGRVLYAIQTGRGFELQSDRFRCEPGRYGEYEVGPIVDILILPRLNALSATMLGVDASGNLLYCAPDQVPQAIPLPVPDTNWGRVTGFTLDSGNLYVLDASSRAIWVYVGNDASFVDRPYFFFGGQIPEIEDSIDLAVNGDDLYLLHGDGHLSTCSYSRLEAVPTRCQDPAPLVNSLPAYQDVDFFEKAHITQIYLTSPPDSTLLLLDADNRNVLRISPRTRELQSQIYPQPGAPLKTGPAGAMTITPNRVLFIAVGDQVYFATDMP